STMRQNSQRGLNRSGGRRGRGRLQRAARRELYLRGEVDTGTVARAAYVRRVMLQGERIEPCHYRFVRQEVGLVAEPVGRGGGRGRPTLIPAYVSRESTC